MRAWPVLVVLLVACGGGGGASVDGDVDQPDGGPALPQGTFTLAEITGGGDPVAALLVLDRDRGAFTFGLLAGGEQVTGNGARTTYAYDESTGHVQLGGDTYTAEWQPGATSLRLTDMQGVSYLFEDTTLTRTETIDLAGRVTLEPGVDALPDGRVAMVALLRGGDFIELPEAGLDQALDFGAGPEVDFQMSRVEGALGVERIAFGAAGIAVAAIVVYQDRDGSPGLDRWEVDDCSDASVDCLRAIAPLFLTYRDGSDPLLDASSYPQLLPGWSVSALIDDDVLGQLGLGSLDPGTPILFTLRVDPDPTTVELPPFAF
jgi:hypothetical protein